MSESFIFGVLVKPSYDFGYRRFLSWLGGADEVSEELFSPTYRTYKKVSRVVIRALDTKSLAQKRIIEIITDL